MQQLKNWIVTKQSTTSLELNEHSFVLIPNRDSPNGYPTVRPAELQSGTLSHQVDTHKTLTTHKLACSCFVAPFGHQ